MKLTASVTREGARYVAECLEVEVVSQGETVEAALANLREALELYFEDEAPMDQPEPPIIASVEIPSPAP